MKSLAGHLLIAPPQERDVDFIGAVILLIQHSEDQAFGVALNRPTEKAVGKVWKGKKRLDCDLPVYLGGPCPSPLMALHTVPALADVEVLPGVFYSIQPSKLERVIQRPAGPLKVFASHFGWGPGQCERLLADAPWQIVPATREHVFDAGPDLWVRLSKSAPTSDGAG